MKNVTIPTTTGSIQIDHIIISRYGVFVVETKNMKGWISGNPSHEQWTQTIGNRSFTFLNPLFQNYKHTKTLESLLRLKDYQIHSVIVFTGKSRFETKMPDNVTYGRRYIKFIKSKSQIILTELEVQEIKKKIEKARLIPSFKTYCNHVKSVKSVIANKEKIKACPECGDTMVLRKAKQGQKTGQYFWGCSRFPTCRCLVGVS